MNKRTTGFLAILIALVAVACGAQPSPPGNGRVKPSGVPPGVQTEKVSLIGTISIGKDGIVFKTGNVDYLLDIPQKDFESIGLKDSLLITIDGLTFKVPKGGPQAGALVLVVNEVSINNKKFTIKRQ